MQKKAYNSEMVVAKFMYDTACQILPKLVDSCRRYDEQGHHHDGDPATWRPSILCSICLHSFGALEKAVQLFKASIRSQKMSFQTCSIDIFIDLKLFACNLKKWGLFHPSGLRCLGRCWGLARLIARPWASISSLLTHMVYLLPFLNYLAGSKSVSTSSPARPSQMRWQIPLYKLWLRQRQKIDCLWVKGTSNSSSCSKSISRKLTCYVWSTKSKTSLRSTISHEPLLKQFTTKRYSKVNST